jgi:hypothetical protein
MATNDTKDWSELLDVALFEPNRVNLRQRPCLAVILLASGAGPPEGEVRVPGSADRGVRPPWSRDAVCEGSARRQRRHTLISLRQ